MDALARAPTLGLDGDEAAQRKVARIVALVVCRGRKLVEFRLGDLGRGWAVLLRDDNPWHAIECSAGAKAVEDAEAVSRELANRGFQVTLKRNLGASQLNILTPVGTAITMVARTK